MFQKKKKKKGRLTEALKFQGKEKKFLEKKTIWKNAQKETAYTKVTVYLSLEIFTLTYNSALFKRMDEVNTWFL